MSNPANVIKHLNAAYDEMVKADEALTEMDECHPLSEPIADVQEQISELMDAVMETP